MDVQDTKMEVIMIPIKRKRKIFFMHILLGELIAVNQRRDR